MESSFYPKLCRKPSLVLQQGGISQETKQIAQETVSRACGFAMLGQGCPNCWPRGGIVVLNSKEKRAAARSNGYSVWEPGLEVNSIFQEFWLVRIHGEQSGLPAIKNIERHVLQ